MSTRKDLAVRQVEAVSGIQTRLAEVSADIAKRDFEGAHGSEDSMYLYALRMIAQGVQDPAEVAREALKGTALRYPRAFG